MRDNRHVVLLIGRIQVLPCNPRLAAEVSQGSWTSMVQACWACLMYASKLVRS